MCLQRLGLEDLTIQKSSWDTKERQTDRQTDRQTETETETDGEGVSIETLLRGNAYIGESQGWVCAINNTGNDNEYVLFKFIVNMMVGRRMKKRRGK